MDASAFDRPTQLGGGRSRRSALRSALAGATLAAAGLVASTASGDARKKCRKKKCPKCPGKALGEVCARTTECCPIQTDLACGFTPSSGANTVCCGTTGVACPGGDHECCFDFTCVNGACRPDE
jgi:hypothetical protein